MKKTLLYFNAFLIFSITFSQVNIKDVQALSNINNTIINDINNSLSMGVIVLLFFGKKILQIKYLKMLLSKTLGVWRLDLVY